MIRHINALIRLLAASSLLALGALAAPAVSAGDPCFHGYEVPPASTGSDTDIALMPCAFAPTVTTVAVGESVTFRNGRDFTHLITGANQAWGSRDVELQPGGAVSYTFDSAGIYPYACALHVGMSGAIVVGDPGVAVAAGSTDTSSAGGPPGGNDLPLVAGAAAAGLMAGAGVAWFAIGRRSPGRPSPLVHAD